MADYRLMIEEFAPFQRQVLDKDLSAPPGSPAEGDRYIVGAAPTGVWTGHAGDIAWYDGAAWQFDNPEEGWFVYVTDENKFYLFNGTAWGEFTVGAGDMLKSTYDTDNDGIVDAAESVNDGTNSATAAEIKAAVDWDLRYVAARKCVMVTLP
ncbi:MAG: DUF2793 domain-containing protein [Armatimonadota bacterium]